MVAVLPVLEEGESDSAKIARLEREKETVENGREEVEEREKEAREEIERLKKD